MILLPTTIVHNLPSLAKLVSAGIDQRTIIQMLVRVARHGIDSQQRAVKGRPALRSQIRRRVPGMSAMAWGASCLMAYDQSV